MARIYNAELINFDKTQPVADPEGSGPPRGPHKRPTNFFVLQNRISGQIGQLLR